MYGFLTFHQSFQRFLMKILLHWLSGKCYKTAEQSFWANKPQKPSDVLWLWSFQRTLKSMTPSAMWLRLHLQWHMLSGPCAEASQAGLLLRSSTLLPTAWMNLAWPICNSVITNKILILQFISFCWMTESSQRSVVVFYLFTRELGKRKLSRYLNSERLSRT